MDSDMDLSMDEPAANDISSTEEERAISVDDKPTGFEVRWTSAIGSDFLRCLVREMRERNAMAVSAQTRSSPVIKSFTVNRQDPMLRVHRQIMTKLADHGQFY